MAIFIVSDLHLEHDKPFIYGARGFESVDDKVFAYTTDAVYESKLKLYMLEEELPASDFFRASKAVIVNLSKIESLSPAFGGRFEAVLKNDYKVIISRNYVSVLKEKLGL